MHGYVNAGYTNSLSEFGTPHLLKQCGGFILKRPIDNSNFCDGMGPYPLFACKDWSKLHLDIEELAEELVSISMVTDPFGSFSSDYLKNSFDVALPFKDHYVIDSNESLSISRHHRYYARRALRSVLIDVSTAPSNYSDEWINLYDNLISKHRLKGIKAFSRKCFDQQLQIPGAIMFRAKSNGITIGAHLWYINNENAYSHLLAVSQEGYRLSVSYALHQCAIEFLKNRVRWIDLGAGAGSSNDKIDGLSKFKSGWSNKTKPAYFCGRILNHIQYQNLVRQGQFTESNYFPAYRHNELF